MKNLNEEVFSSHVDLLKPVFCVPQWYR